MQLSLHGTKHEIYAMAEWLPAVFPLVKRTRIRKDSDGPLYRLYADVYPLG
ncbi:MAG TPA: hypothetical protein VKS82_14385 [Streptosporangiaceae bacterium]|nr:hypothetical protein [Streptosporangiaceae bacterium]